MKPTQEQVIAWARHVGMQGMLTDVATTLGELERFAIIAYEAGQTDALSNIDPSKLMSYQEGYEAGRKDENEACAAIAAWILKMPENDVSAAIRARREQ